MEDSTEHSTGALTVFDSQSFKEILTPRVVGILWPQPILDSAIGLGLLHLEKERYSRLRKHMKQAVIPTI
jgi:hypothetical protein